MEKIVEGWIYSFNIIMGTEDGFDLIWFALLH